MSHLLCELCLGFRDQNEEAARLVGEMKLDNSEVTPTIRMYRNGQPQPFDRRVFGITSIKVCGF